MWKPNELKRKLAEGEKVWGLFCSIPTPLHVEMIACAGYDFVIVDTEHASVNPETLENMIRAAEARDLPALVRVPNPSAGPILRALDAGARGVVVPHVRCRRDAEAALQAARYFPEGMRSLNGGRVPGFGRLDLEEYLRPANREVMVVPMIEDREGVDRIDEILSVDGVDMVLEGAADLSQSLGIPWQTRHPGVKQALERIREAADRHGVPFCALPRAKQDLQEWENRGVRAFVLGEERGLAFRALRSHLERMKEQTVKEGRA
ncbi:4-hydroxy-2-oxoheptanedioate aldolase [Melghirimyces profundicolus]|uniref:4-hydroxy-2-oxoheptanedioate aldolase n=1 Tax=Melghirimyces profundicolus TaxID=1242148 RepID=A0A2T6C8P2_9BACL|nr:aldolase/citrate lyase family protein [Melghirimyces profundicolus]PTX64685.1 4-hydroxy-2-oxoheptanedioate aldolase [Melghirimyces profundicolus]